MEGRLIERLRTGDTDAFSQLVEKYKNFAYSTAFGVVRNHEAAEEIAQDAFIKVYRFIGTFTGKSKFSTWLFRIVYNTAVSTIRTRKQEYESIEDNVDEIDSLDVQSAMDRLEEKEQREIIDNVMNALSHEDSTILTLYYLEEFNVKEISEMMDISKSNVKVKLFRARKRFYNRASSILRGETEPSK